jgi:hypothetical protein
MDTSVRSMAARCAALVDDLPIPNPFTLEDFLRRLGTRRGKPIRLHPTAIDPQAPCGVLINARTVDIICHARDASPLHRLHIVLHEIGHLEFGHQGHAPESLAERLMPNLDASAIQRLHNRTVYRVGDEREAELFATLAGDRITRLITTPHGGVPRDMTVVWLRSLFDIPIPSR